MTRHDGEIRNVHDQAAATTEPRERELTEYEKGYLDGVLAYAHRAKDGEVYVGRGNFTTYRNAARYFLSKRGLHGWDVRVS